MPPCAAPVLPLCGTPAQDLRNVEHMYQFSLTSFIALFSRTLRKPMDAKSIDARISALVRATTYIVCPPSIRGAPPPPLPPCFV